MFHLCHLQSTPTSCCIYLCFIAISAIVWLTSWFILYLQFRQGLKWAAWFYNTDALKNSKWPVVAGKWHLDIHCQQRNLGKVSNFLTQLLIMTYTICNQIRSHSIPSSIAANTIDLDQPHIWCASLDLHCLQCPNACFSQYAG